MDDLAYDKSFVSIFGVDGNKKPAREVRRVITHPIYLKGNGSFNYNNIAVLELSGRYSTIEKPKLVFNRLSGSDITQLKEHSSLYKAGFGVTRADAFNTALHEAAVTLLRLSDLDNACWESAS